MKGTRATPKLLFTNEAGSKLYGMAKKDGSYKWTAYSASGRLLSIKELLALIRQAGLGGTIGEKISSKAVGNHFVVRYGFKGEMKCRK